MPAPSALIDLSTVRQDDRAAAWRSAVPSLFPGLSVSRIDRCAAAGDVRRTPLGAGTFWAVHSPAVGVDYTPSRAPVPMGSGFSVLLQIAGRSRIGQQQRMCVLEAGDICVLDEQVAFSMEGDGTAEFVFLRMPRAAVLNRNPRLERRTALALPASEPGVQLVSHMLSSVLATAPALAERQRGAALISIIDLLGAVDPGGEEAAGSAWWRVQAALSFIELNFGFPGLTAEEVAQSQRISRRRLDQVLREAIGLTITGQIWKRRLDQAASDLIDPARASLAASQIAFANGFEDAAHFTRAFKRSHGCSPLRWRALHEKRPPVTQ